MIFLNNNLKLAEDSLDNIYLFTLYDGIMTRYYFQKETSRIDERKISEDLFIEYDIEIDQEDTIYIMYQNKNYHLVLMIIKGEETKRIVLTEEPIPEVYNLNLKVVDNRPHIFYCILLSEIEKEYRIIHHWFNGIDWITNIVDETKVKQLLNPMCILEYKEELILIYYDMQKTEEVYFKNFDLIKGEWSGKVQLTNSSTTMLYLDSLLIDNKLHLTYCEYGESLTVKYERYEYGTGSVQKELEKKLSNEENISWPTLIYYEDNLWVVWAEYESIMSRFSLDKGKTWSPIYQWKESKTNDIVRYKYSTRNKTANIILNYSYGTIQPDIGFVGFGSLDNTTEIPLKKKMRLYHRI